MSNIFDKTVLNANAPVIDWTRKERNVPYYDARVARQYVVVTCEYGGGNVEDFYGAALLDGAKLLLEDEGKNSEDIETRLKPFSVDGFYVEPRSDTDLKILVGIPYADLAEAESAASGGCFEKAQYYTSFATTEVRSQIEQAVSLFDRYALDLDVFEGSVENFDFRTEASRLLRFIPAITELFEANGLQFNEEEENSLEVVLDGEFNVLCVTTTVSGATVELNKGMSGFLKKEGIDSSQTMRYVYLLNELNRFEHDSLSWTDFLATFQIDVPKVFPNAIDLVTDITDAVPLASLEAAKLDAIPFKGFAAKSLDDKKLIDPSFRDVLFQSRRGQLDFVGDNLFANLPDLLDGVKNIDDVFTKVLNKISIDELISFSLTSIGSQLPTGEIDIPEFPDIETPKLPDIQTLQFPDNLPTTDIMGDLTKTIEAAVLEAITQIFVLQVRGILSDMTFEQEEANGAEQYGVADMNDMIADPNASAAEKDAQGEKTMQAFAVLGLVADTGDSFEIEKVESMLSDVSQILTPVEICSLFNGTATDKTFDLVLALIEKKYPDFDQLDSKTQVKSLFKVLSNLVDLSACEQVIEQVNESNRDYMLCDPGVFLETRKQLLRRRGLPEEQIEQLIDEIKDRKKQRAEQLTKIMKDGFPTDMNDAGNVFCNKKEGEDNAPASTGWASRQHPSVSYLTDKVLDSMLSGIYTAFDGDARDYPDAMISDQVIKEEITDVTDPRLVALGFTHRTAEDVIDKDKDKDKEGKIEFDGSRKRVLPHLRTALQEMEINQGFDLIPIEDAWMYKFILPADTDVTSALQIIELPTEFANVELEAAIKEWAVRYAIPLNSAEGVFEIDDEYVLGINENEDIVFEIEGAAEIQEDAQNVVDELDADIANSGTYIPQQEMFGEFISETWKAQAGYSPDTTVAYWDMKKYFSGPVFAQASRDLFAFVANRMADSPYFQVMSQEIRQEKDDIVYETVTDTPLIRLLDLTPNQTEEQKACGYDPQLLGLDEVKEEIKAEYARLAECEEIYETDGLGRKEPSAFEKAVLKGATIAMIRAFIIDYFLRGIFAFSSFKFDNEVVDDVIVQYFNEMMRNDLQEYDEAFYNVFVEYVDNEESLPGLDAMIGEQYGIMSERFNTLLGTPSEDIMREFLGDLPKVQAQKTLIEERFVNTDGYTVENGQFVLEEYIWVEDFEDENDIFKDFTAPNGSGYTIEEQRSLVLNRKSSLKGIVNPESFYEFFDNLKVQGAKWCDTFKNVEHGLRLVYVAPASDNMSTFAQITDQHFVDDSQVALAYLRSKVANLGPSKIEEGSTTGEFNFRDITASSFIDFQDDKRLFRVLEVVTDWFELNIEANTPVLQNTVAFVREINLTPLVDVRYYSSRLDNLEVGVTPDVMLLENVDEIMKNAMMNTDEFKFLFEYVFPIKRFFTIMAIYSIQAASSMDNVPIVFSTTKEESARLFTTMLNGGDYQYEDPKIAAVGDDALKRMADNMAFADPSKLKGKEGLGLAFPIKAALSAPLIIFKGIVEMSDPNITISSKIHKLAKSIGADIPMPIIAFGLLPANVFPPPVGFGPPITPMGFVYLALSLGDIEFGEKSESDPDDTFGVNLNTGADAGCPEEDEE